MNLQMYLAQKQYGMNTMVAGPIYNLVIHNGEKQILSIKCDMRKLGTISQQQFDSDVFRIVKEQIEIYEEELKNGKEEEARTDNN